MVHSLISSLFTSDLDENLFIQSKYLTTCIIALYILFSKVVGPGIMKNRKPMDLKSLILLYNSALVVGNIYISYKVIMVAIEYWPYRCDIRNSPLYIQEKKFHYIAWTGFVIKYFELFDTVFFVLRKKFNQISFLHVFHHTIVCFMIWIYLRQKLVGYYLILIGTINCPIHVLLYTYYTLAALGPGVRKYLWWKKYLTTLQIMQFFVVALYMSFNFLVGCEEFGNFDIVALVMTIAIAALFLNFYIKTY